MEEHAEVDISQLPSPQLDEELVAIAMRWIAVPTGRPHSDSRLDRSKSEVRAAHERIVQQCLAALTDENAHEMRARLRKANAALDLAEQEIDARRTTEEIRIDESEMESRDMSNWLKELKSLGTRAWAQALRRDPAVANRWKAWHRRFNVHGSESEWRLGIQMLGVAARRAIDAARRTGGDSEGVG